MMMRRTAGALALTLALLVGAGLAADPPAKDKPEKDTPDLFIKDVIKQMGAFADTLEKIKDKASAEKAKPRLVDITRQFKKIEARGKKVMGGLQKEEREALQKKYKDDLEKASKRLNAALGKALKDPDVQKVLKEAQSEAEKEDKKPEDKKDADKKDADKKSGDK